MIRKESKVSGPVCNLTSVMVLAHVLLGCCWHHQHALGCQRACATTAALAEADCAGHSRGHEHVCSHQPAHEKHHPPGCEGVRCVFVSGQPSRASAASAFELFDVVAVAATVDDGLPARFSVCTRAGNATRRCPPLRTHLLDQVLLL